MTDQPIHRPNGFSEATGEICYDLPSAYIPHRATGLLHLAGIAFGLLARWPIGLHLVAESPVPIQAGGDILDGRIYFGSKSHLYSYRLA